MSRTVMVRCDNWECMRVEQIAGNWRERRARWRLVRGSGWVTYRDDNARRLDLCPVHRNERPRVAGPSTEG